MKGRAHINLIATIEGDDLDAAADEVVKKLEEAGYKAVELEEVEEADADADDDEDGDEPSTTPED